MNPTHAEQAFTDFLAQQQTPLQSLTAQAGIDAMLQFYQQQRFDGCAFDDDADMLLFQWGREKEDKGGAAWLEIVRQLMLTEDSEDEGIWQLSLRFTYSGSSVAEDTDSGDVWCSTLDEVDDFQAEIISLPLLVSVGDTPPQAVTLMYENAG